MTAPTNYCTPAQVAALTGHAAAELQQDWFDWIDRQIELWTGNGYKGATKSYTVLGDGNSYIRLPSKAASITSITENGTTLDVTDYKLDNGKKMVRRVTNSAIALLYGWNKGIWLTDIEYVINYVEPNTAPIEYNMVATECVKIILGFKDKFKDVGIALSATDSGMAGRVSSAASNTYPPDMLASIQTAIRNGVPRTRI